MMHNRLFTLSRDAVTFDAGTFDDSIIVDFSSSFVLFPVSVHRQMMDEHEAHEEHN